MSDLPSTTRAQTLFLRAFHNHPDGPPPHDWPTPSVLRRWLKRPGFRRALATLHRALKVQHRLKLLLIARTADTALRAGFAAAAIRVSVPGKSLRFVSRKKGHKLLLSARSADHRSPLSNFLIFAHRKPAAQFQVTSIFMPSLAHSPTPPSAAPQPPPPQTAPPQPNPPHPPPQPSSQTTRKRKHKQPKTYPQNSDGSHPYHAAQSPAARPTAAATQPPPAQPSPQSPPQQLHKPHSTHPAAPTDAAAPKSYKAPSWPHWHGSPHQTMSHIPASAPHFSTATCSVPEERHSPTSTPQSPPAPPHAPNAS